MNIEIETSSIASWQKLIHEAQNKSLYTVNEDLESYLIFMLIRFTQNTEIANTILALDYLESQNLTGSYKHEQLRNVGDKCLLFAGFYPEQAHRKLVTLQYFVEMGQGAYSQIANTNSVKNFAGLNKLFNELARNFMILLDILHHVKLLDATKQWMLDEITKFEKQKLENSNKITFNSRHMH
jgi:hypothetical protein